MRIVLPSFIVLLLFCLGCGNPNPPVETIPPAPIEEVKAEPEVDLVSRQSDTSPWYSTAETADLEKELNVTAIAQKGEAIEKALGNAQVDHQSCNLAYGPGTLSFYRQGGKVVKIRVDWVVDSAHSHIEYFLEGEKLIIMDFMSRDYATPALAKESYAYGKPALKHTVTGRYYLKGDKVLLGIGRDWASNAQPPAFSEIPLLEGNLKLLQSSFGNDISTLLKVAKGELTCIQLADAGYFP